MNFQTALVVLLSAFAVTSVVSFSRCEDSERVECPFSDLCIKPSYQCDGDNDCRDGTDEMYCSDVKDICGSFNFYCSDSLRCLHRQYLCDGEINCADKSDEAFCALTPAKFCPRGWLKCNDYRRCFPAKFKCDGHFDCLDRSDEMNCPYLSSTTTKATTTKMTTTTKATTTMKPTTTSTTPRPPVLLSLPTPTTQRPPDPRDVAVGRGIRWLLQQRKSGSTNNRWGPQLHRISTALFLAEPGFFAPGNRTGEEMSYELTIQLLFELSGNSTLRSQELALYVQALLVTCEDPRDFFGRDLLSELRSRVEATRFPNPFEILTLCNAGDKMTHTDVQRVSDAYESAQRPFWTDTQAIASMAMQCLFSSSPDLELDERVVKDMQDELKKRQFRNGSVENLVTTAMVAQAMLGNDSYTEYFNMPGALNVLINSQKSSGSWGSIQKDYYILPVLKMQSLVNISSKHCQKTPTNEEDALHHLQETRGEKLVVTYSVWIGKDVDLGRTWKVRMPAARNITFYDVIETVSKLDHKHSVVYSVVENKPYVNSLFGKEDDPELGVFWFTYVRSTLTKDNPKLIETSPVFVKVSPNQELILWYKPGNWEVNSPQDE